jgi:hypothetical protein
VWLEIVEMRFPPTVMGLNRYEISQLQPVAYLDRLAVIDDRIAIEPAAPRDGT